jgi:hypothetical protein
MAMKFDGVSESPSEYNQSGDYEHEHERAARTKPCTEVADRRRLKWLIFWRPLGDGRRSSLEVLHA